MIKVIRRRLQEVNVNFLVAQPLLFKWVLDELILYLNAIKGVKVKPYLVVHIGKQSGVKSLVHYLP